MNTYRTVTNNIPRDIIHGYKLTDTERAAFDYLDDREINEGSFFRYKGQVYDLGEFMRWSTSPENHPAKKWDGYMSTCAFHAVVVRYTDDCERVIVGEIYSCL